MRPSLHKWNELDNYLCRYAATHHPDVSLAMAEHDEAGDDNYVLRCLGALVRKRAETDAAWFFKVVAEYPNEVISLSQWIQQVVLLGIPQPDSVGLWAEWIGQIRTVHKK